MAFRKKMNRAKECLPEQIIQDFLASILHDAKTPLANLRIVEIRIRQLLETGVLRDRRLLKELTVSVERLRMCHTMLAALSDSLVSVNCRFLEDVLEPAIQVARWAVVGRKGPRIRLHSSVRDAPLVHLSPAKAMAGLALLFKNPHCRRGWCDAEFQEKSVFFRLVFMPHLTGLDPGDAPFIIMKSAGLSCSLKPNKTSMELAIKAQLANTE